MGLTEANFDESASPGELSAVSAKSLRLCAKQISSGKSSTSLSRALQPVRQPHFHQRLPRHAAFANYGDRITVNYGELR